MGRTRAHLDPPTRYSSPYMRAKEPGFHYWISGADLYKHLAETKRSDGSTETAASGLFNPPGSEWLTMRPVQMNPEHFRNIALDAYVIPQAEWTFATGITATSFEPTRRPSGVTNTLNQFMLLQAGSSISAISPEDWDGIFTAAQVTKPTGFATSAVCFEHTFVTPIQFWDPAPDFQPQDYHPFIQWRQLPGPDATWAFSMGPLTIIFSDGRISVLKDDPSDSPRYTLLGHFEPSATQVNAGPSSLLHMGPSDHSILVMPVGHEDVYLFLGGGGYKRFTFRKADDQRAPGPMFTPAGPWMIGMSPSSKLGVQVQVVGYEWVTLDLPEADREAFNLGPYYRPSEDPIMRLVTRFDVPYQEYAAIEESYDPMLSTYTLTNTSWVTGSQQSIEFSVVPEQAPFAGWDGSSNWSAHFEVIMTAGAPDATPGFLAPQIRRSELMFPALLEERPNSALILSDTEVAAWECETSYYEPLGKKLRVELWDSGVQTLVTNGFLERDWFPIHIEEEVSSGNWQVRVAAWVRRIELEELKSTDPNTQAGVRRYTFEADALLCRAETEWMLLPQLVDPNDGEGFIQHDYAVAQTLHQSGFDVDDPIVFQSQVDPGHGTNLARLPGTWGTGSGQTAKRVDSPWAPDWDKSKLDYIKMLAEDFRGWVIHEELDGLIRYHQDLMLEGAESALIESFASAVYYPTATLYWSKAAAASAGVPGQWIMTSAERGRKPPRANVVRITLDEPGDDLFPHYMERWDGTIDDVTDANGLGEWVPAAFTTKLAVEERALKQMCRVKLLQLGRRSSPWTVTVPLPPWRFATPIAEGDVITLDGDAYGAYLIVHLETRQLKSADSTSAEVYRTKLTLDRLPEQMTLGTNPGAYPGQGQS